MAVKGLRLVRALGHLLEEGGQVGIGDGVAVPSHPCGRCVEGLDLQCAFGRFEVLCGVVALSIGGSKSASEAEQSRCRSVRTATNCSATLAELTTIASIDAAACVRWQAMNGSTR